MEGMKQFDYMRSFFLAQILYVHRKWYQKSNLYWSQCYIFFTLQNLPRFVARTKILNYLQDEGLLNGIRDHGMSIPLCSRTGDVIEPLPKPQWFLRYIPPLHTYIYVHMEGCRCTPKISEFTHKWSPLNFTSKTSYVLCTPSFKIMATYEGWHY